MFLCLVILLPSLVFSAENLDELEARKARKSVNTFYSGAGSGNNYVFQPQGVIYTDTTYNHEVTILTQTAGKDARQNFGEYGWQPWSADGKRMAFEMDVVPGSYTVQYGYPWFTLRSDGTKMRPFAEGPARTNIYQPYFDWSPVEPDVAYQVGKNYSGRTGLDINMLYKVTVSDTSGSYASHVDLIPADTSTLIFNMMKQTISGDGAIMMLSQGGEEQPFYVVQLTGTPALKLSYNMPNLDSYWGGGGVANWGDLHDEGLGGNASQGYWWWWMYGTGAHWRARPWGTDNGTPTLTTDHIVPYDWYSGTEVQKKIQYLLTDGNIAPTPWATALNTAVWYSFHQTHDVYGTKMAACTVNNSVGFGTYDLNNLDCVGTGCAMYNWDFGGYGGCSYSFWPGFTDYAAAAIDTSLSSPKGDKLAIKKWNATTGTVLSNMHVTNPADFIHPGQSPDGTKLIARTDWLQPSTAVADLLVTVAYYPYPPQVTATAAAGGTVTVRWDWQYDKATKRTYSTRGWPNETTDNAAPPREIEKYRLWRSADKITWTPLNTTNHDIFNRYNFTDGTWLGNSYWTITDAPGDGAWYYAVTSMEWSGLESRTLSNIYAITVSSGSGTGTQDTVYTADPGKLTNPNQSAFYTSYNATNDVKLVRYYNIYAEDGSAPTISQANRVASIPAGWGSGESFSWVDWLGKTDGTTQYKVTKVDTQGNESSALAGLSYNHQKSPATAAGQYTVEWTTSPTDTTPPSPPQNVSVS